MDGVPQIPAPDDHYPAEFAGHPVEDFLPPRARVFVNEARTVLVDLWLDGTVTVATRSRPDEIWGPPVYLKEEK